MFNLDEMREQLEEMKRQIEIVKEADGVLVKFLNPALLDDPNVKENMMNTDKLVGMKNMMPGMEDTELDLSVEQVDGGIKFTTSNPDAFFELFNKVMDPDFMVQMMEQMMKMMSQFGEGMMDGFGEGSGFLEDEEEE